MLGVIGFFGLSTSGKVPFGRAPMGWSVQPDSASVWVQQIALVDEALGRGELSRALYQWRDGYGAASRSRHSDALFAVGDRAIRIGERPSGSGYFMRFEREAARSAEPQDKSARSASLPTNEAPAHTMTPDAPEDVVTVLRFVPLGRAEQASSESAIVAAIE